MSTIATVSASLRMFDMMTRPLQQVTQALNLTITSMDQMNNAANKDIRITNTLNTARGAIQKANAGLQELASAQEKARNSQDRLNDSFDRGNRASDNLLGKVKGLVGAYLGFEAAKKGIEATVGGAMGLQQQLFTLQGIMGNKDVATEYFNNLQKKGNESVFAFEDFAANARKFMQFTKNTDSLDRLANLSERLTLMDPTQGLEGAGFALKEAMSGDFVSLKERFGFGKADAEILKASKDMGDFITKFDTLLNKKGFTESMLQQYNKSAAAQFDNLKSNSKTALAQAGNGALEVLAPVITRINEAFSNGSFQTFFNGLSIGLTQVVNLALGVVDVLGNIANIICNNWGIIAPIIYGIVAALAIYKGIMLASAVATGISSLMNSIYAVGAYNACASLAATELAIYGKISAQTLETMSTASVTAAQWGLNAALLACPITWIIVGIITLIAIFYAAVAAVNHFAGTSLSATGIIAGAFAMLGAHIYNVVAYMWNVFAAFVEFFANVFNHPVYSVKKLFVGLATNVLDMCISMTQGFDGVATNLANAFIKGANIAVKAVNGIIGALNKIPGVDIGKVGEIGKVGSITSSLKGVKKNLNGWLGAAPADYWTAPKMQMKSIGGSYNTGYNFGKNLSNKFDLGSMFNKGKNNTQPKMPDMAAWNKAQGPGGLSMAAGDNKLGKHAKDANKHLKNINDKIDVSNEHLEMMRDLAEKESIQNFVTLTPTVQVTTGDIKEEADINKIISKIETYMEGELVNSAEGVYA